MHVTGRLCVNIEAVGFFCSFLHGLKKRRVLFEKTGKLEGRESFEEGFRGDLRRASEGGAERSLKEASSSLSRLKRTLLEIQRIKA